MASHEEEMLGMYEDLEKQLLQKKLDGQYVVSYQTPAGHRVTRQPVTEALKFVRAKIQDLKRLVNEGTKDGGYATGRT